MKVNGEKIRKLRESKNISAAELGSTADRSERWVHLVQTGKIVNLNRNIAKAIAYKLGCKLEDISA